MQQSRFASPAAILAMVAMFLFAPRAFAAPAAPSNLAANAVSQTQINLTWRDNSSGEDGFKIERKSGAGSFAVVATVGQGSSSYANSGLNAGSSYTYRVRAYFENTYSSYSNQATATTSSGSLPAPSNLAANAASQTQINLTWRDNSSGEDGFRIERKSGSGAFAVVATVGTGSTSYQNSGLSAATSYQYRILAFKGTVNSAYSGEATATTLGSSPPPPPPTAGKYAATNGSASGQGTLASPWDLASALNGQHPISPGETLWIRGGTYQKLVRPRGTGFPIRLAGTAGAPIHIRPYNGERVTIDGGISIEEPSNYLWIWDLEIIVSLPHDPPISPDASPTRPSGGFHAYTGNGCKFINLVVHGGDEGCGFWQEATNGEIHGCIFYDTGFRYTDPEVSGGHAIYTQNNTGIKTISDNIILDRYGSGYSIHAYGSEGAFVNNYRIEGNIVQNGGPVLVGGGKPSSGIHVLSNYLYGDVMRIGYDYVNGLNLDAEVRDNLVGNGTLDIIKYQSVINTGNLIVAQGAPRPQGSWVRLRPNKYDTRRANLAIFNWARAATVAVDASSFLTVGTPYRILNPRNFYGTPVLTGTYNGSSINVPVAGEFGAFVILK